ATVTGVAEDNAYNSALRVVNDLRVTQRLPYGGDVSARLLARATEDLREKVAGEGVQTAELILSANIPLLRGAGLSAAESRIQAERTLVYAARTFEEFRRQFLVNVARDFLGLVVQSRGIENSERQLIRLRDFQAREEALVQAGRQPPFQAALSAQDVLFAEDNLRSQKEAFRLAVDRFKVRLNIPVDQEVEIVPSTLGLPVPEADMDEAVRNALAYRLDLQNRRDQLDDTYRAIDIAKNQLLPDLDFSGSVGVPSDPGKDRDGLQLDFERNDFSAGITFGLPLDRETERLRLRQAQIAAERAQREYQRFRDTLVIDVRDAVREIDRAAFSLRLQEENIAIARRRLESIEVAPDRATARDKSDAADGLTRAENDRDRADRDLQVSILEYLLQTGTLRVNSDGTIRPLQGMTITPRSDDDRDDRDDNNREAGEAGGG
ncbi:MAG: TolC family protein, partial [Phycisphaerales bacterium]|nr:TolC family protein [Phycisphaerales bacterium]